MDDVDDIRSSGSHELERRLEPDSFPRSPNTVDGTLRRDPSADELWNLHTTKGFWRVDPVPFIRSIVTSVWTDSWFNVRSNPDFSPLVCPNGLTSAEHPLHSAWSRFQHEQSARFDEERRQARQARVIGARARRRVAGNEVHRCSRVPFDETIVSVTPAPDRERVILELARSSDRCDVAEALSCWKVADLHDYVLAAIGIIGRERAASIVRAGKNWGRDISEALLTYTGDQPRIYAPDSRVIHIEDKWGGYDWVDYQGRGP